MDALGADRDHEQVHLAEQLLTRALEAHAAGRQTAAFRLSSRAMAADPPPTLRARVLLHHAYHMAERRSVDAGLALLAEAASIADLPSDVRGSIAGNRGVLLLRAGSSDALASLDESLHLLPTTDTGPRMVGHLNRGIVHLQHRQLTAARRDFLASRDLALADGQELPAAKASFNLAYALMLAGDLPACLREMDAVMPLLTASSPAFAAVCHADRAQALLSAGLLEEAADEFARAATTFGGLRLRQDQAEAELGLATVLLLRGDADQAARVARRASARFTRRGATTWAHTAERIELEASLLRLGSRRSTVAGSAARALALAEAFEDGGYRLEARRARLVGAEAALAAGVPAPRAAELAVDALRLRRTDPLAVRLHTRRVRSSLAAAEGDERAADAELRAAVKEIHRYQSGLGSLDLQTASGVHVDRIGATGLRRALNRGSAAGVYSWSELARGMSSRLSAVTPPADAHLADLLEQLRATRLELSAAGTDDTEALRSQAAGLERAVREATWQQAGGAERLAPTPLARLREALRAAGGSYVAHLGSDDRLFALVVTAGRARLAPLGPLAPVIELIRRVRSDLDVLAGGRVPPAVRAQVARSTRLGLDRLDELVWQQLPPAVRDGGGPVVLTPAARLTALPWTMLPGLAGRAITIAPTATTWLGGRPDRTAARIGFVVGPDLTHAHEEVRAAASVWPDALVLPDARTADVLRVAGQVDVLHVAAHGSHQPAVQPPTLRRRSRVRPRAARAATAACPHRAVRVRAGPLRAAPGR